MSTTAERIEVGAEPGKTAAPIIIDLGKRKKKDIKRLQEGTGKLIGEITDCIDELVTSGACAKDAQPIVLIVREKPKSNGLLFTK